MSGVAPKLVRAREWPGCQPPLRWQGRVKEAERRPKGGALRAEAREISRLVGGQFHEEEIGFPLWASQERVNDGELGGRPARATHVEIYAQAREKRKNNKGR